MTEKELKLLGFDKESIEDLDYENNYYYVLDIVNGLTFITNSKDQVEDDKWHVEIFNTEPTIRFKKFEEVQSLINKLKKSII
jgi:hypothetical protein